MKINKQIANQIKLDVGTDKFNTISLDRLDNTKGYEEGNIAFCCSPINIAKNKLSIKEFINLCQMVYKYHKENE